MRRGRAGAGAGGTGGAGSEVTSGIVPPVGRESVGLGVAPSDGPQLARFIERETKFWHKLIRDRKLSLE